MGELLRCWEIQKHLVDVGLAGAEDAVWEGRLVRRIGIFLWFQAEGGVVLPALQVIDGGAQVGIVVDGYAAGLLGDPFGDAVGVVYHAAHQYYVGTLDGVGVFVDQLVGGAVGPDFAVGRLEHVANDFLTGRVKLQKSSAVSTLGQFIDQTTVQLCRRVADGGEDRAADEDKVQ